MPVCDGHYIGSNQKRDEDRKDGKVSPSEPGTMERRKERLEKTRNAEDDEDGALGRDLQEKSPGWNPQLPAESHEEIGVDDPEERNNVSEARAGIVSRLSSLLEPIRERTLSTSGEHSEVEVDHELERTLKSLGYVQ